MDWLWTILIGFVAGLLARAIKPGNDKMGIIFTTLLGIAGALLATWVGQATGMYAAGEPAGFIAAVIGAIVLLVIYSMVRGRKR